MDVASHLARLVGRAEATDQVKKMFNASSVYYDKPHTAPGIGVDAQKHCTVTADDDGKTVDDTKKSGDYTGSFDSNTKTAVESFQRRHGLIVERFGG